jgi:phospholipid/cholesterol/gamma-HCH transport system substrate-binding protein
MRRSSTLNIGAGAFVLLGFAALAFMTTQTTSRGIRLGSEGKFYDVTARFDNIGDLRVGAPVSMAGVEVGRVSRIDLDTNEYKAVVSMRLNAKFDHIPSDTDASIYTQGLLGGKFVGLTAGGADTYLKDKSKIDFTQSALVLENLIGQFMANFAKGSNSNSNSQNGAPAAPAPATPEKTK